MRLGLLIIVFSVRRGDYRLYANELCRHEDERMKGSTIRTADRTTLPLDFFVDAGAFLVEVFSFVVADDVLGFLDGGVPSSSSFLVVDLRFAEEGAAFDLGLDLGVVVFLAGFTSSSEEAVAEEAASSSSASCTTKHTFINERRIERG